MATLEQLSTALVNADQAGDVDAAKALAAEISRMRSQQPDKQASPDKPQTPYERATAGMGYGAAASRSSNPISFEQGVKLVDQQNQAAGANGALGAGLTGFVQGIPIAGPALLGGEQRAAAGLGSMINGQSYSDNLAKAQQLTQAAQTAHPNITTAGEIGGAVVPMLGVGSTALGARALGIEGPSLLGRIGMSAASNAGISAADTAARGGSAVDVVNSGIIGGGVGGGIPIVGAGFKAAIGGLYNKVAPTARALLSPDEEAARRVGTALARDTAANPKMVMSAADEAAARSANIPVVNADRGGEVTRALVRSVANQSPEARAVISNTADDRFATQGNRAVGFVRKMFGGNVDDIAVQDAMKQAAEKANGPAYRAAFSDPNAQSVFTPRLQQLMQSPSLREAIDAVPGRSADRGAVQGFKEISNPFSRNSQGNYVLRQKADGTLISPNLQFWNQVKINLDSAIGTANRGGDNARVSDLMGLKKALVGELDNAVPSYQTARQGAAAFFGADDALEAGKKFATQPTQIPEAKKAFDQFTPMQKATFATGYASSIIDKIKTAGDRTNVINSMFKNQAARESMEMVVGPQKARELEAYVRVEDMADKLRGSLGNSTTARQLVEMGIGAGVGGGAGYGLTGDWKGAALGAVAPRALKYAGAKADTKVMQSMANLLMKDDPASLKLAVAQAARNPAYMAALDKLSSVIAAPARGAAVSANQ